jgi:hypothetical protein
MPKKVLFLDEELFVAALDRAIEEGDGRFVDGHIDRLDSLISRLNDCLRELSKLQYRAQQLKFRTERTGAMSMAG